MGRFDGRVAVITGAARGIGFGTTQRFAEEGAAIAIVDLDESAAAEAAEKVGGSRAIGIGAVVSNASSAAAAIKRGVKIGRASRRTRECQYGEMKEVDGS